MKKKTIIILSTVAVICLYAIGGIACASKRNNAPDEVSENVVASAEVLEETKQQEAVKGDAPKQEAVKYETVATEATKEPVVSKSPAPTETPKATAAPAVTNAPAVTTEPKATAASTTTEAPKVSEAPKATEQPKVEEPKETAKPKETATPKTEEPKETAKPKEEPKATEEPKMEVTPEPTPEPTPAPTPEPTEAPHEHDWETRTMYEATCTGDGYEYDICKICGEEGGGRDIAPLGHDFDEQEVRAGDCVLPSVIELTCKNCGYSKREEGSTTDDHDWETAQEAPTVDMVTGELIPGETYERCSVCNIRK